MSELGCPNCKVEIGEVHVDGCSLEICAYCGDQAIKCHCVLVVAGIDPEDFGDQETASDEQWERFDAENRKYGGRIPWSGEYPGSRACREFGFWCREVGERFVSCTIDDEGSTEDLNRLHGWSGVEWNRKTQSWEYKGKSCTEAPEYIAIERDSVLMIESDSVTTDLPLNALATLYGMYDLANGSSEPSIARIALKKHVMSLGLLDNTCEELERYRRNIVARVKGLS